MHTFAGYVIIRRLDETPYSIIYRARRQSAPHTVILKALKTVDPSPALIARLKHEYELIRNIKSEGVVRVLDIVQDQGRPALIMADFEAVSLKAQIQAGLGMEMFLDLAARIAEILGSIHQEGITHRDIKPGNILYNRNTDTLKLTDFGIAAEITRKSDEVYNPEIIEGTLAYISPEQTGRINCPVDYRTDLYSLGITFYEMLTGGVPFKSKDPLAVIHGHIAKKPAPPHEINPHVPQVVSGIVMKLMAKIPEERYQNAFGLMADLKQALNQLRISGRIEPFPLGANDISLKFSIPQILVGREQTIAEISTVFESVVQGSVRILLVAGDPGIGKSSVVNRISRNIPGKQGNFITGKYDQLRKSVPYSAIIQAFRGLVLQIYGEGEERLRMWRDQLKTALGANGKIITDAIAEMTLIIGPQPDIEALGPDESQNRFNRVFNNFVKVFAGPGHPLVFMLDDLQWADSASLNLIRAMAADKELSHLLFIGAYRNNEVPDHHPLMLCLEEIAKDGIQPRIHTLAPLNLDDTNRFLVNFLRCDSKTAMPLTRIIHNKTLGNPFFINQFLKTLYEERYLTYNVRTGWQWDMSAIRAMQVTDNVVDLMTAKLVRMPKTLLELVKICACIGNHFDVEALFAVTGYEMEKILSALDEIVLLGLVHFSGRHYHFHHDRIQEAAYSLIDGKTRQELHYRIAKRLLETTAKAELPDKIFYIADQFNQAPALLSTAQERRAVAELNLTAGIKAKDATAYATAEGYLKAGLALLENDAWRYHYELTFALHLEAMTCLYLNQKFAESERLFAEINRHVNNNADRAGACCAMIVLYTNIGKHEEAVDLGVRSARMFGVRLPKNASKLSVLRQLIPFLYHIKRIGIENIPNLPEKPDPEKLHLFELYASTGLPAYFTNPNLYAVTVLKALNLNFTSGLNAVSPFGLMATATILTTAMEDYRTAYRLSQAAFKLQERIGKPSLNCKVNLVYGILLQHFVKPLDEGLAILRKGYQAGLDSGDFLYAGHCIVAIGAAHIVRGNNLDQALAELERFRDFIATVNDPVISDTYAEARQTMRNLKGLTDGPYSLTSADCDQEGRLEAIRENGNLMNLFFRLVVVERIHYLHGDYETAYQLGGEIDTMLDAPNGAFHLADHFFYRCLSLLAVYPAKGRAERKRILRIFRKLKKKMRKLSRSCPENYLAKYRLIDAEFAAASGAFQDALDGYRKAAQAARDNGILHVEALSHERAAIFFFGLRYDEYGRFHIRRAHGAYRRWGALAKVQALEKNYPHLAAPRTRQVTLSDTFRTMDASTMGAHTMLLDLSTVVKVSQAISGEILLDRLLSKIMTMTVQNAGAQRGFFILNQEDRLTIEAAIEVGEDDVTVLQAIPLTEREDLCVPMVRYVRENAQNVILGNAAQEGLFINDSYVVKHRCKSMLCMPIQHKGQISGILYMENNLTHNAFTENRLELLHLFLSQAAIALENARLFELATIDGMTKLFVHRYFQLLLDQEIGRGLRYQRTFSLILTDIDNFKQFNDTYGHQLGDEVLKTVAHVIRKELRAQDIAARYGGEEFAVVLPETDMNNAFIVAEKLRNRIADTKIPHEDQMLRVTISLGVATFPVHASDKQTLIRIADKGLYAAKRNGKNQTRIGAS